MEKYRQLVQELYTEPKDEEILGSFLHAESNGNDLTIAASNITPVPKIKKMPEVQMKDIRRFFNRNKTQRDKPDETLNEEEMSNETVSYNSGL